jgi:HD superfamily phosphodiesterase
MKSFVTGFLKKNIPDGYYYHNYVHTIYVFEKAVEIGNQEGCTAEEIRLLGAAALLHDTGFVKTYKGHEEESCLLARKYLPEYGFAENDVNKICGMIMATKLPQSPNNKLEEIIADADLEYLGTDNAATLAKKLFKERHHLDPLLTKEAWNKTQVSFLQNHHYFTSYCRKNKESKKLAYLKGLLK